MFGRGETHVVNSRMCDLVAIPVLIAAAAALTRRSDIRAQAPPQPIRVVLVGDSTVTDDSGWGAGFRRLVSGGVEVVNMAANGRSSKSFIDEGRWTEALAKRGQYYLIQFGHNDEPGKGPERETDPKTTYRVNMARYVDEARAIGAKPVLSTSRSGGSITTTARLRTTQTPYFEAVGRWRSRSSPARRPPRDSRPPTRARGRTRLGRFSVLATTMARSTHAPEREGSEGRRAAVAVDALRKAVPELPSI